VEWINVFINSKLTTFEVSSAIAEQAAHLRSTHNIRTPDAIQISAALNAGATQFFTNDIRLPEIPYRFFL
jgi:predicted nucleic acid-binding protein